MIEVDSARFGPAAKSVGDNGVVELTKRRRQGSADRRSSPIEILLHPPDEVVAERLDLLCPFRSATSWYVARSFSIRQRIEKAHRVTALRPSGDLRGAENRRVIGSVGKVCYIADIRIELRRASDASRVEDIEARGVAAEIAAEVAEVERTAAGHEKRSLLRIIGFVRRQVDCRGIHLHLSEIRIDCRIESEARRQQVLEIGARAHPSVAAAVVRVAGLRELVLFAGLDVRKDLQLMGLFLDDESVERPEIHRTTRLTLSPEGPHILLIEPICVPPDLHSPRLQTVARETKLRVRNSELGRPSERIDLRSGLPDGVPRRITVELIAANTRRIDLEPGLVDVVVVRVEDDDELIGRQ